MKTYLLAAAAALSMTPALAHAEAFNGAYGGVELGWEDTHGAIGQGLTYGVIAGYNKKVADRLVLGVEGNAALSTADETFGAGADEAEVEAGRTFGIAARVGVLPLENTMVYGKIGYDNIRTKVKYADDKDGFNTDALVLGGGVEYAITPQATVRVGYDYTNGEEGYRRHQVKTGVAFHF
ncbi:outer membrane protein [Pedomonas mirosovicensis]|uniref:outer membrane protein n=1 Tax=Pedomonas mirosovicensis TaxID=2908641 RepID=UPI002169C930|nr:porin family protein [Pedomonas mirosovicensis]MCH8685021.1 porin family protein [Pedomonas mirosovicensis]